MDSFNITTVQGILTFAAYCIPILLAIWLGNVQLRVQTKVQINLHKSQQFERLRGQALLMISAALEDHFNLSQNYVLFKSKVNDAQELGESITKFGASVEVLLEYLVVHEKFFFGSNNDECREVYNELCLLSLNCVEYVGECVADFKIEFEDTPLTNIQEVLNRLRKQIVGLEMYREMPL